MDILSNSDKKVVEQFRKGAVDILPDDEKMTLGRRIERKIRRHILFVRYAKWAAAASIALLISIGYLWYSTRSTKPTIHYNIVVIETLNRKKQKVVLPDSTVVWLNANSRLEYQENFNENRFVRMEGEALFDVANITDKAFTINALELEVTVVGTIFNINAYKNETEIVTTLVEGEIVLNFDNEKVIMKQENNEQQVVFNKNSKEISFENVDTELFTSWVKGLYKFENASFEQIAKQFERMYGIEISFENDRLKKILFTGTFLHEQNIETVLELLQEIRKFKYLITGNKVIIKD